MIILSLNVKGVGGNTKSLALKHLFEYARLDVVCIQETMVCGAKAGEVFSKLLVDWEMCTVDSIGKSGGLFSSWKPFNIN